MFKIITALFRMGPTLIHDYLKWMRRYAKHPDDYPFEVRYKTIRELVIKILHKFRLEFEVNGLEKLNGVEGPVLIVSNHLSLMDSLTLIALSKKPISFVSKKENEKMPMLGKVMKALDSCFLDRGNLRQNGEVLAQVEKRLEEGVCSYVIFPEGTRQKNVRDNLLPMHPGSFKIAGKAKVPLIPVAQYGTFHLLGKGGPKSIYVQVSILDAIQPEVFYNEGTVEAANRIRASIQENVNKLRDRDDAYHLARKNKKKPLHPDWVGRYQLLSE
ncbi:MAG: lysophospholipid acyltransferase family protein [Bacillota bacterium]|nr:lysophospholipid acyltransferase family protein [Bacillota bacterium]